MLQEASRHQPNNTAFLKPSKVLVMTQQNHPSAAHEMHLCEQAAKKTMDEVVCDTSGRLYTNIGLME